jgi:hypothetical protein
VPRNPAAGFRGRPRHCLPMQNASDALWFVPRGCAHPMVGKTAGFNAADKRKVDLSAAGSGCISIKSGARGARGAASAGTPGSTAPCASIDRWQGLTPRPPPGTSVSQLPEPRPQSVAREPEPRCQASTGIAHMGAWATAALYCCTKINEGRFPMRNRPVVWVELRGFEPLTPSMRTRCATGLRYSPENLS